jgi:hypothetical protein
MKLNKILDNPSLVKWELVGLSYMGSFEDSQVLFRPYKNKIILINKEGTESIDLNKSKSTDLEILINQKLIEEILEKLR